MWEGDEKKGNDIQRELEQETEKKLESTPRY